MKERDRSSDRRLSRALSPFHPLQPCTALPTLPDHTALLVDRIREDDREAFREFFELHQPGVFGFLFRYTHDRKASEDLLQDTFLNFWQARKGLRADLSARAYLYRIARNLALNHLSRTPRTDIAFREDDAPLSLLLQDPHDLYDRLALMDDFEKALSDLPERCRAVFVLSRYQGMPYDDIAQSMQISLQTVKNQMSKAISILRKRLARHLE
jgi:RNA polymerase sigma-70 factor (ECF subfamily)